MPLDNPENEIRGENLTDEESADLVGLLYKCPHGTPKDTCLFEQSLRIGKPEERPQNLYNMLKTADDRRRTKILLKSHGACAKERLENR